MSELVLRADVPHEVEGVTVIQRGSDSYFDATAMCRAYGKVFAGYRRLDTTTAFLTALADDLNMQIHTLVQSAVGGKHIGTWVHPRVAIHLAEWCSPEFAVRVNRWVFEYMSNGIVKSGDSILVQQFIRELGPYHERGLRDGIREGMGAVIPLVREAESKADTAIGVATQAIEMGHDLDHRVGKLESTKKGRRRDLTDADKQIHRLTVARRCQGYCPVKGERCIGRIVDGEGNMLRDEHGKALGEYDHHYDVGKPNVRQSWLVCHVCHAELSAQRLRDPRNRRQSEFDSYQKQVEIVINQVEAPLFSPIGFGERHNP